ncbi:MAG: aldose epimerase [Pseudonocardiales bacterium]|nr:MAG: aldose epimerase [Pseudonocardiales bacterium]
MTVPVHLDAPGCRASFDPSDGGRLTSLMVSGHELLVSRQADAFRWGSFVLAPWVGMLRHANLNFEGADYQLPTNRPHVAVHGLVTERSWRVAGDGVLTIDVDDPWPWRFRVTQRARLTDSSIAFDLLLESDTPMPAAVGWHPWFVRRLAAPDGHVVEIELHAEPGQMWANDADGLPTGELTKPAQRPWDYCFRDLRAPPVLRWPGILELTVESSCSDWVFFDEEQNGICVEPWSAPPNSLNMADPFVVTSTNPLVASMTWTWRRL